MTSLPVQREVLEASGVLGEASQLLQLIVELAEEGRQDGNGNEGNMEVPSKDCHSAALERSQVSCQRVHPPCQFFDSPIRSTAGGTQIGQLANHGSGSTLQNQIDEGLRVKGKRP